MKQTKDHTDDPQTESTIVKEIDLVSQRCET